MIVLTQVVERRIPGATRPLPGAPDISAARHDLVRFLPLERARIAPTGARTHGEAGFCGVRCTMRTRLGWTGVRTRGAVRVSTGFVDIRGVGDEGRQEGREGTRKRGQASRTHHSLFPLFPVSSPAGRTWCPGPIAPWAGTRHHPEAAPGSCCRRRASDMSVSPAPRSGSIRSIGL